MSLTSNRAPINFNGERRHKRLDFETKYVLPSFKYHDNNRDKGAN